MVWSVVVAKLPSIGFTYTTHQLFWLAALPGLSGATLRIFYSFMVPIFGGRLWTTLTAPPPGWEPGSIDFSRPLSETRALTLLHAFCAGAILPAEAAAHGR